MKAEDDLNDAISSTVNSDEQAQLATLRAENEQLKKKQAETAKELQEQNERLSTIV